MADQNLFLQREARMFVQIAPGANRDVTSRVYEIPVLEGFSFSQSSNLSEVTLSEASKDGTNSRRGRMAFTDSLSPAEFSFSTYSRPFQNHNGDYAAGDADDDNGNMHSCEDILWSMMVSDHSALPAIVSDSQVATMEGFNFGTQVSTLQLTDADKLQLATADIIFIFGTGVGGAPAQVYRLKDAVLNEATINFDIDGVCTIEWSGFATSIDEVAAGSKAANTGPTDSVNNMSDNPIVEGIHGTNNLIMNRLSTLKITEVLDANTNYVDAGYDFTLTGGSITLTNNIEYVTPSSLGSVSTPLAHFAGTRSVSGSFTCYLSGASNESADFFEDIIESSKFDVTNMFKLEANIGGEFTAGASQSSPFMKVTLPACHVEIPNINVEEVLSLEVTFNGLPNNSSNAFATTTGIVTPTAATEYQITGGKEMFIEYCGPVPQTTL